MNFIVKQIVVTALIGGFLAGIPIVLAWKLWDRTGDIEQLPGNGLWGGAIAVGLGYAAGHVYVSGQVPPFPPIDSTNWIFWGVLLASGLGMADSFFQTPRWFRLGIRLVFLRIFLGLLLSPLLNPESPFAWAPLETALWLWGLDISLLVVWTGLEQYAKSNPGPLLPGLLWLIAFCSSICILLSETATVGAYAGSLAGISAAFCILAFWKPGICLARGAIPPFVIALSGVLLIGKFFANLPASVMILLGVSPLAPWISQIPFLRSIKKPIGKYATRILPVLLVLTAAGVTLYRVKMIPSQSDNRTKNSTSPGTDYGDYGDYGNYENYESYENDTTNPPRKEDKNNGNTEQEKHKNSK